MKVIIAVDPGKQGGIAIIRGDEIEVMATPLIGKGAKAEIDTGAIAKIFIKYKETFGDSLVCATEAVHSIFGTSAKANFQFGRALGLIEGIIAGLQLPYVKVPPKDWQKELFQGVEIYYKKKPGGGKTGKGRGSLDTKLMALIAIRRLYPKVELRKSAKCENPHDGIVDSLCIAHYVKLTKDGI